MISARECEDIFCPVEVGYYILYQYVEDWEAVARVHGERFRDIQPANTLVQADLVGDEYLMEMEAEAVVEESGGNPIDK